MYYQYLRKLLCRTGFLACPTAADKLESLFLESLSHSR